MELWGPSEEEQVGAEADVEPLVQVITTNLQPVQDPRGAPSAMLRQSTPDQLTLQHACTVCFVDSPPNQNLLTRCLFFIKVGTSDSVEREALWNLSVITSASHHLRTAHKNSWCEVTQIV